MKLMMDSSETIPPAPLRTLNQSLVILLCNNRQYTVIFFICFYDYESDFETESTARTSPTKSVTLPYSSPHRCFTQSYGAFYSTIKTPSSTRSENPGEKYLKSSFPNLVEQLGRLHKHRPSKVTNRYAPDVK